MLNLMLIISFKMLKYLNWIRIQLKLKQLKTKHSKSLYSFIILSDI